MATWSDIDWAQPWLAPYRVLGEWATALIERGALAHEALTALLERGAQTASPHLPAGPLRFVAPEALPPDEAYEAFIARTACVPTRHNLHDFFNGLVWLTWPALKRRLHEIQAQQIAQLGVSGTRGVVRDAVTLFDENGALFDAPHALRQALVERDWSGLFLAHREQWRTAISRRSICSPSRLRRCRCWACRAGGRRTPSPASTRTRRCSGRRAAQPPRRPTPTG